MIENIKEMEEIAVLIALRGEDRNIEKSLDELAALAESAGATVVARFVQNRREISSATYLGKGKLDEVRIFLETSDANLVICDNELSGSQARNIEEILGVKVIDRSTLILDIFAKRATSTEGKLQVELAQLKYNLPRLVGVGGLMAKYGGGIGMRGPGEKKLEIDKRIITNQINDLEKRIEKLEEQRELRRGRRNGTECKTVGIVGYTNAGKSTLMNVLAKSNVLSENKLFATLDPVTRKVFVTETLHYLITDTVGFVSKLPHEFINAFSSTLEEAKTADVLLHVLDVSSDEVCKQYDVVMDVLKKLKIVDKNIITVYNKIDKAVAPITMPNDSDSIFVSAATGQNMANLQAMIIEKLYGSEKADEIARMREGIE